MVDVRVDGKPVGFSIVINPETERLYLDVLNKVDLTGRRKPKVQVFIEGKEITKLRKDVKIWVGR